MCAMCLRAVYGASGYAHQLATVVRVAHDSCLSAEREPLQEWLVSRQ